MSQPALSNLLKRKWAPSLKTARAIADIDGHASLEAMIGPIEMTTSKPIKPVGVPFPNLEACISYWAARKQWSPWTIAAAKAGYFGAKDIDGPEWEAKLDALEALLGKGLGE